MPKARTKETITFRILTKDKVVHDPYTGKHTVQKGMYEINDGFHTRYYMTRKEFNKYWEVIDDASEK